MLPFFKKTFSLIFVLIATPLCGCSKNNVQRIPAPTETIFSEELPPQAEEEKNKKPVTEYSPFWNVDNVDISKIDPTRKLVAFTFDDSPAKTLESIVGVFVHFNEENPDCPASATLFCNGMYINEHTVAALHTAHVASFELGNHTYSHKNLTTLSETEIKQEISRTDELLEQIDGNALHLIRAPYGKIDERMRAIAKVPIIDWFVDTLDWANRSADEIYNTAFEQKAEGNIILMHDGYENTVTALKKLLPDLKKAGYQVVSVSQMAKAHGLSLRVGGVYTRARRPKGSNS